ncbi:LPXTG cell wall anchor domain-containing protein [Streptomyces violaceorubidus]
MGTGAAALAVTAIGATTAHATDRHPDAAGHTSYQSSPGAGKNNADSCRFSLDGDTWMSAAQFRTGALASDRTGNVHIAVRGGEGDTCTVSLASYGAQGSTWQTSGKQVLLDFDTVTVAHRVTDTLDITVPGPDCFAQIDLYVGDTKHDGVSADLPEGPDHPVFGNGLIAAWHGGTKTCDTTQPSQPASVPPASTPTPSTSAPSTPASTPAPSTSVPSTPTASAPPATTAPAATPVATSSSSTPTALPSPSKSEGGSLAHTGSSNAVPLAAGAAALLAAGGGLFAATRRRQAARKH